MFHTTLRSPTLLTRTSRFFYIIDCWHHRVLFSPSLASPLKNWSVLSTHFSFPHSLATNSQVFLVDSTGNQQLFLFSLDNHLLETIDLPAPHHSPHYLYYHSTHQLFYCLCARSQSLLAFSYHHRHLILVNQYALPFSGHYCRSFYCANNDFYFPLSADHFSSPDSVPRWQPDGAAILHLRLTNHNFQLLHSYSLPLPLANPNFLTKHLGLFYLTTTPSLFVRFRHFSDLPTKKYQPLNDHLPLFGTPYYLSYYHHQLFLPFIDSSSGIFAFSPSSLDYRVIL